MQTKYTLDNFMKINLSIKRSLIKLCDEKNKRFNVASDTMRGTVKEEVMDFSDSIYEAVRDFKREFLMLNKILPIYDESSIMKFFDEISYAIADVSMVSSRAIENLFTKKFSDLNPELSKKINVSFKGTDEVLEDRCALLNSVKSINEFLHIYHAAAVNNNELYKNCEIISSGVDKDDFPVNLRGEVNEIGVLLYDLLNTLNVGETEICCATKQVFVMLKGKADALTINIEKEGNLFFIKYHIPITIDENTVAILPGNKSSDYALDGMMGEFSSNKEMLFEDIKKLINNVPQSINNNTRK